MGAKERKAAAEVDQDRDRSRSHAILSPRSVEGSESNAAAGGGEPGLGQRKRGQRGEGASGWKQRKGEKEEKEKESVTAFSTAVSFSIAVCLRLPRPRPGKHRSPHHSRRSPWRCVQLCKGAFVDGRAPTARRGRTGKWDGLGSQPRGPLRSAWLRPRCCSVRWLATVPACEPERPVCRQRAHRERRCGVGQFGSGSSLRSLCLSFSLLCFFLLLQRNVTVGARRSRGSCARPARLCAPAAVACAPRSDPCSPLLRQKPLHVRTPLIRSAALTASLAGCPEVARDVWLKIDALQPTGSFKIRGIGLTCSRVRTGDALLFTCSAGPAALGPRTSWLTRSSHRCSSSPFARPSRGAPRAWWRRAAATQGRPWRTPARSWACLRRCLCRPPQAPPCSIGYAAWALPSRLSALSGTRRMRTRGRWRRKKVCVCECV